MLSSSNCPTILLPIWYLSILLLICSLSTPSTVTIKTQKTDRLALLAVKSQLHDPLNVTSTWNNSVPLCLWRGVTCSGTRDQRVAKLDLRSQSIGGRLSPFIGNLSFLWSIHLENNSFYGEIPSEVGRLWRLQHLYLFNNSFSGTIPTSLSNCSNLIRFAAYYNNLVGEIPKELGYLSKLETLSLPENHLTGQLPAFIGNLSALQIINLKGNRLNGGIPDCFGQLRDLISLNLAVNNFSGMLPPSIYNLSSLLELVLAFNRLTGTLPSNIGFILPNLENLSIYGNGFVGLLPSSLSNSSNLARLDVANNHFSGMVSIDFGGLNNIIDVALGQNHLGTGKVNDLEFITSLINSSRMEYLGLEENQFGGVLPHSISNLSTTLIGIAIGVNQISGTIPPGIRNLVKLTSLDVSGNQLTGSIPPAIGELKELQILGLGGNSLRGSIPISLGNLTLLNRITLDSNNLQGNMPSTIGNCQNLIEFTAFKNKLTGNLPRQIFDITTLSLGLDLSDNLLSGPLPSEVGNLKNLVSIKISNNRFSGDIPSTLGGCSSLEYLRMQGNSFSGNIPSSLSSLRSIKELDLSSNNFSGQIPEYFQNLSFLEYLNLSYNHFEGEVPTKGVFKNATKISLLGNEKLCGGLATMHLPSCHSKRSMKSKFSVPKVVAPLLVSCLILSLCFIIIITRRRKAANESSRTLHMEEQFPMVSYADLNKATNEFSSSNLIGQGNFGFVYKGLLSESNMLVAVKVINLQQKGASKSFIAECEALRKIRHRNLTKVITICSSIDFKGIDFKALVYKYMQNGSLDDWLHQNEYQVDTRNLSLIQRLNIAIDVASAIEYLHHHCQPPIIHADLKPSNILLNQDMVAHVSDFGLAKFLLDNPINGETQSSSIGIKGTIGYVAPEYGLGNDVSISGDVYSFGVLLLEMFTGKRPTDNMFNDEISLHHFAKVSLPERVMEIVEPSLLLELSTVDNDNNVKKFTIQHGEGRAKTKECLVGVMRIGVVCSMESPAERMEMANVVAKLCSLKEKISRRI
ncbi:hypothetical protein JRO89_XS14G0146100 [Xanthoceras sorbifolium]|uniref:Protein kinase domain-containing protein n=1 Tax=Xanthoceras sorbifolium TaxID=99658 RepID=A0ABQ8H5D1_9ROSI|nr:hypothetical protein JRO89_XS14G0146100 [Xanthoceras sorbifolium]